MEDDLCQISLDDLWEQQLAQQQKFGLLPKTVTQEQLASATKDLLFGLYEEVQELTACCTHYRLHDLRRKRLNKFEIVDEIVDVLKYTFSIAMLQGVSRESLAEVFVHKTKLLNRRYEEDRIALQESTSVLVCDLDGCICDLTPLKSRVSAECTDCDWLDAFERSEKVKDEFYSSGGFRKLSPYAGAVPVLKTLRAVGYKIVIITARPQWQYKRIHSDTVRWLEKHDVPCDLLLFNKDKAEAIYAHVLPARPVAAIEDRDKHVAELVAIDVPVLLVDRPWNTHVRAGEDTGVTRVATWASIAEHLLPCP